MRLIRLGIEDFSYAAVRRTGNESGPKCSCRIIVRYYQAFERLLFKPHGLGSRNIRCSG